MIYLEKNDIYCTLTTYLYCHMWLLWSAEQQGKRAYINWPKGLSVKSYEDEKVFHYMPNQFEWYFKQPHCDLSLGQMPPRDETWTWESYADPSPVPFMAQPLKVIKDYYKLHLHFN